MNKQMKSTGWLLVLAATSFWISWFLMPDPGTTDAEHILAIVKQSRAAVFSSVIVQIISSVLYVIALTSMAKMVQLQKKALIGVILLGIGILGLCSDAFFHLLAYLMTSDTVTISDGVIRTMELMQTIGVYVLVPLLFCFFVGSFVTASGLGKQAIISKTPAQIFIALIIMSVIGTVLSLVLGFQGPFLSLILLGLFASGQALIGIEFIIRSGKKYIERVSKSNRAIATAITH